MVVGEVQFSVLLDAKLYEQLCEASMALGMSKSKLAKIALNYAIQIGIEQCKYEPASVDVKVTFSLTPEQYRRLKELAKRQGTSIAAIMRSALACFLQMLKPYMGKFFEINGVKVPAWAVKVLSMVADAEGRSTDELIAWAIIHYAKEYAKKLRVNIAELNKAVGNQGSQS